MSGIDNQNVVSILKWVAKLWIGCRGKIGDIGQKVYAKFLARSIINN